MAQARPRSPASSGGREFVEQLTTGLDGYDVTIEVVSPVYGEVRRRRSEPSTSA
jgi:hypothetical protein